MISFSRLSNFISIIIHTSIKYSIVQQKPLMLYYINGDECWSHNSASPFSHVRSWFFFCLSTHLYQATHCKPLSKLLKGYTVGNLWWSWGKRIKPCLLGRIIEFCFSEFWHSRWAAVVIFLLLLSSEENECIFWDTMLAQYSTIDWYYFLMCCHFWKCTFPTPPCTTTKISIIRNQHVFGFEARLPLGRLRKV